MRLSQFFFKTQREKPKGANLISHQLLLRGGFIHQLASGSFSLLPLGFRVFNKIKNIIRMELNKVGCQEILMPIIQPSSLWRESGRYSTVGAELLKAKGRDDEFVVAMTHEEAVTDIVRNLVHSYEDLPFILNQFQTKFRDEARPRGGLIRLREFIMQDAYSFDRDKQGLDDIYNKVSHAYEEIFKKIELPFIKVSASSGVMGGGDSEEFMVLSEFGEDEIVLCKDCDYKANIESLGGKKNCPQCGSKSLDIKKTIEVAHLFKLETEYSSKMKAYFVDKDGKKRPIWMGCYGIGLERVMASVVETYHDKNGIIWPKSIAPFAVHLVEIVNTGQEKKVAEEIYNKLLTADIEVIYDDRDKSPGFKFTEADLIGCPLRLTISRRSLEQNSIEIKERSKSKSEFVKMDDVLNKIKSILGKK